jgi:GT2 family glycosyltransferase
MAEVVVLIVGYNNAGDIRDCLRALARMEQRPTFDVYIAENGGAAAMDALTGMLDAGDSAWTAAKGEKPLAVPTRGSRLAAYRLAGREDDSGFVHVVQSSENFGYAGGINVWLDPLLTVGGWNAVWVLNPDTEPHPDALAELAAYAEGHKKGMVGSLIVREDYPKVVWMRGLEWRKWTSRCLAVGRWESATDEPDPAAVEATLTSPSGASIYVTKALIERIGPMFDPYFLYFEDLEWGVRAKRVGELGYAHRSVVVHKYGTTIGSSQHRGERSPLAVYMTARNAILFTRRNYPAMLPSALAMQLAQTARFLTSGAYRNAGFAFRGMLDGCLGRTGRPDPMPSSPKPDAAGKAKETAAPPVSA